MAYRSTRRTPRLECLDDRTLPSVTIVESNGTLVVRGDQYANHIVISDDGTGNAGAILVEYDGQEYWSQAPVNTIRVVTGGGADSVDYHTTWDLASSRKVVVNLGNGDDNFTANLNHSLSDSTKLAIFVNGGNGQDNLSFDAFDEVNGVGVDIPETAELCVRFAGGNGQDILSTSYLGVLSGSATFISDGGNGKDDVSGNIKLSTFELAELPGEAIQSTGTLNARMRGNNGVDNITLNVVGDEGLTESILVANGGHGKDTFTYTENVSIPDSPKK